MRLHVVVGTWADKPEVIDKSEFERAVSQGDRVLLLGYACAMINVAGDLSHARCPLGLSVDFQTRPIVVDGHMLLEVERARNQHSLSGSSICTRNQYRLRKRDELVGGYGGRL